MLGYKISDTLTKGPMMSKFNTQVEKKSSVDFEEEKKAQQQEENVRKAGEEAK